MLTRREIAAFVEDGFVVLRGAIPRSVAAHCRRSVDARLRGLGVITTDPSTWKPVVQIPWPLTASFTAAAAAPALTEAYDQLLGGRWRQFPALGGAVLVRFPARRAAHDALWHIDGSFLRDGEIMASIESPGRGFTSLMLLSDVGTEDAPTQLKVGSHLDVAPVLAGFGPDGCPFLTVTSSLPASTFERPTQLATGRAGDVFLCHPFLLHQGTGRHRGEAARYLAQPGYLTHRPFRLEGPGPLRWFGPSSSPSPMPARRPTRRRRGRQRPVGCADRRDAAAGVDRRSDPGRRRALAWPPGRTPRSR